MAWVLQGMSSPPEGGGGLWAGNLRSDSKPISSSRYVGEMADEIWLEGRERWEFAHEKGWALRFWLGPKERMTTQMMIDVLDDYRDIGHESIQLIEREEVDRREGTQQWTIVFDSDHDPEATPSWREGLPESD